MVQEAIPTLFATQVVLDSDIHRYRVWCDQCRDFHYHGPMHGHREAHCWNPDSLYHRSLRPQRGKLHDLMEKPHLRTRLSRVVTLVRSAYRRK